jgi:protein subunit release factor B
VLRIADDVDIQFARSGGAGGQNVNKVNTKVDMRLKLDVPWLSEEMRSTLLRQARHPCLTIKQRQNYELIFMHLAQTRVTVCLVSGEEADQQRQ